MSEEKNLTYSTIIDRLFQWKLSLHNANHSLAWGQEDEEVFDALVKILDNSRSFSRQMKKRDFEKDQLLLGEVIA